MRICIDARMMGAGNTRGIGRFIEEIVASMLQQAPQHRFILIVSSKEHRFVHHAAVESVFCDIPWYGWREQLLMPRVFRSTRADRFFVPHWNVPFFGMSKPLSVFIHDLLLFHEPSSAKISLRHPLVAWFKRKIHWFVVRKAVQSASTIFVPTEFVKQDVLGFFPELKEIFVTGEGMPEISLEEAGLSASVKQSAQPFLLYVGSAYPHKGLEDVLMAWPNIRHAFPNIEWRIVGEKDAFMKRLEERVAVDNLSGIRFLGRVDEETLQTLYRQAEGLLYPSRFEGFGLPPLEALAAGCPVIARRIPVLVEVLGEEGAFFFRDGSNDAILTAVRNLLADPVRAHQTAQATAKILAKRHQWSRAAQVILNTWK